MDALLDFGMEVTLDGETLRRRGEEAPGADRRPRIDAGQMGRGRPRAAEPDARPLPRDRAARVGAKGCRFGEAMRLLAGADGAERERRGPTAELERGDGRRVAR